MSRLVTFLHTRALPRALPTDILEITSPVEVLVSENHREGILRQEVSTDPRGAGNTLNCVPLPSCGQSDQNHQGMEPLLPLICLQSATTPRAYVSSVEEETYDMSHVPLGYHDLSQAFSQTQACSLPPHNHRGTIARQTQTQH